MTASQRRKLALESTEIFRSQIRANRIDIFQSDYLAPWISLNCLHKLRTWISVKYPCPWCRHWDICLWLQLVPILLLFGTWKDRTLVGKTVRRFRMAEGRWTRTDSCRCQQTDWLSLDLVGLAWPSLCTKEVGGEEGAACTFRTTAAFQGRPWEGTSWASWACGAWSGPRPDRGPPTPASLPTRRWRRTSLHWSAPDWRSRRPSPTPGLSAKWCGVLTCWQAKTVEHLFTWMSLWRGQKRQGCRGWSRILLVSLEEFHQKFPSHLPCAWSIVLSQWDRSFQPRFRFRWTFPSKYSRIVERCPNDSRWNLKQAKKLKLHGFCRVFPVCVNHPNFSAILFWYGTLCGDFIAAKEEISCTERYHIRAAAHPDWNTWKGAKRSLGI